MLVRFLRTPLRHPDKIYETGNGYISLQGQMGLDGSLRSFEESLVRAPFLTRARCQVVDI